MPLEFPLPDAAEGLLHGALRLAALESRIWGREMMLPGCVDPDRKAPDAPPSDLEGRVLRPGEDGGSELEPGLAKPEDPENAPALPPPPAAGDDDRGAIVRRAEEPVSGAADPGGAARGEADLGARLPRAEGWDVDARPELPGVSRDQDLVDPLVEGEE